MVYRVYNGNQRGLGVAARDDGGGLRLRVDMVQHLPVEVPEPLSSVAGLQCSRCFLGAADPGRKGGRTPVIAHCFAESDRVAPYLEEGGLDLSGLVVRGLGHREQSTTEAQVGQGWRQKKIWASNHVG